MADPALLIRIHEKARQSVIVDRAPQVLLNTAAHLLVLAHDCYHSDRIARSYFSWAQANQCLEAITWQAKERSPNFPSPFNNENWNAAWTNIRYKHRSMRPKIDDIESRLHFTDVQVEEDCVDGAAAASFDTDIKHVPEKEASPEIVVVGPETQISQLHSTSSHHRSLSSFDVEPANPSESEPDLTKADFEAVPALEVEAFDRKVPEVSKHLSGRQLRYVWDEWQTLVPPEYLLAGDWKSGEANEEFQAILSATTEQLTRLFESSRQQQSALSTADKSKGKGKATEDLDTTIGHSQSLSASSAGSSAPSTVFSTVKRLSSQSTTSLVSDHASNVGSLDSREDQMDQEAQGSKKIRKLRFKNPLGKLVKRVTSERAPGSVSAKSASSEPRTKECSSCFDDVSDAVTLKCQHNYCRDCFGGMISSSCDNEAQWPPRCCMIEIPRKVLVVNLSAQQLKSYHEKEKEFSIKPGERWYCSNLPACGKFFVPKARGHDVTQCTYCKHQMCTACRGPQHPRGERCRLDPHLEAMMHEAELEGWRQCIGCSAMVELNTGCRHITCRCGAEFCYTCGARWRTCSCTEADQERRNAVTQQRRLQMRQRQQEQEEAERLQREILDQEQRELEAALEAVARQQEADMAARKRAEEEEARRHEAQRLLAIEMTYDKLLGELQTFETLMLEQLVQETMEKMASLEDNAKEVHELRARTARDLKDLDAKHAEEVLQIQQRHDNDMTAFKKLVERYAIQRAMGDESGSEESPLDRIIAIRDRASASYDALEQSQQDELTALGHYHDKACKRLSRQRERLEQFFLAEFEIGKSFNELEAGLEDSEKGIYIPANTGSLEDRRSQVAMAAAMAYKWWQHFGSVSQVTLADRKERLIATGADAPDFEGLVIPQVELESLPESVEFEELPGDVSPTSGEMPGSFPCEAPARAPPVPPKNAPCERSSKAPDWPLASGRGATPPADAQIRSLRSERVPSSERSVGVSTTNRKPLPLAPAPGSTYSAADDGAPGPSTTQPSRRWPLTLRGGVPH